jgi:head-tail adaptor
MSFGKMTAPFQLLRVEHGKDAAGFPLSRDILLHSGRAYKEQRHGTEVWANRAAFSKATTLFRFRAIPGVAVDITMLIACAGKKYNIISAEDVRGKGMYIETLCESIEGSER